MLRPRHPRSGIAPHRFFETLENRRLLSAGQLDPSFGTGGKVTVDFHGVNVQATAVATQNDGKTVVVGTTFNKNGSQDFAVVRLNVNGSLDTSFGSKHTGIVVQHVGDSSDRNSASAVKIDPSGGILVAGSHDFIPNAAGNVSSEMTLLRFTSAGKLDQFWGDHGVANIGFGVESQADATAIALQSNGEIVLVGVDETSILHGGGANFGIARLTANGQQDDSFNTDVFGNGGTQDIGFDDDAFATGVVIDYTGTKQTNPHFGQIVVTGFTQKNDNRKFAMVRLQTDGDLDSSFHGGGNLNLAPAHDTNAVSTGVTMQSNGDIIASGFAGPTTDNDVFAILRLTPSGKVDTSFAGAGKGWAFTGFGGDDRAQALVVGQDNRLILGGTAGKNMAFAAFTPNGTLDSSFGTLGRMSFNFGNQPVLGMAYGPGHRFVAAGGGKFNTARLFDTGANLVHAQAINTTASEVGPSPAGFFVFREERLPVATRVFFTVGGTATSPTLFSLRTHTNDYSLTGMSFTVGAIGQPANLFFADIPANQTFVSVDLNPIDRKLGDGDKTATFNIIQNASYDIGDPSKVTITIKDKANPSAPVADAYVRDGSSANTNFGSATDLETKTAGAGFNRRSYLKFDLSGISSVNHVSLTLFAGLSAAQAGGVTMSLFSVADTSWTESGITFNNAPAGGSTALASATVTTAGDPYTFDITSYVKSQFAAGHHVFSLMLKNPSTSSAVVTINSREASSHQPLLLIS